MNVQQLAETAATVTIGWTPAAGQEGYVPTIDGSETLTDGKRHPGTSKTQASVKIGKPGDGKPHAYGVNILGVVDSGSVTVPPVVTPPPPGTVEVHTLTDLLHELDSTRTSSVFVRAGAYGKLVIPRSCNGRVIFGEAGTVLAGIYDEFGGYHLRDIATLLQPGGGDENANIYFHGNASDWILERVKAQGGSWCIKQYSPDGTRVANGQVLGCDLSGASEDITHWDGIHGLLFAGNHTHDPAVGMSEEHPDAFQIEYGDGVTIDRNRMEVLNATAAGADNSQVIFVNRSHDGRPVGAILIVNNLIHTNWGKRGIQILSSDAAGSRVLNNTVLTDNGDSWGGFTGGAPNLVVVNNVLSGIGFNGNQGSATLAGNWITSGSQAGQVAGTGPPQWDTNYRPTAGSPLKIKGISRPDLPTVDLDGKPRTTIGIGCYA